MIYHILLKRLVLLAISAMLLSACGSKSDGPAQERATPPAEASNLRLEYIPVTDGQKLEDVFALSISPADDEDIPFALFVLVNIGNESARNFEVVIAQEADFFQISDNDCSSQLDPRKSCNIIVTAKALDYGEYSGTLKVRDETSQNILASQELKGSVGTTPNDSDEPVINDDPVLDGGPIDDNGPITDDQPFICETDEETGFSGGDGKTADTAFEICSADQLSSIGSNAHLMEAFFKLTSNIDLHDLSEAEFNMIGGVNRNRFKGQFDGQKYTISNLKIDRPNEDRVGLFRRLEGAVIKNVRLKNVEIRGKDQAGGLAGRTYNSIISNSYASGIIEGRDRVGGLIGFNYSSIISNSYATGNVEGRNRVGGLVGSNYFSRISGLNPFGDSLSCKIFNSYAAGTVEGRNRVGGLVGYSNSSSCKVFNSFWNVETSSLESSAGEGARGITTYQMQQKETFADGNWDFKKTWAIDKKFNGGSPYLR